MRYRYIIMAIIGLAIAITSAQAAASAGIELTTIPERWEDKPVDRKYNIRPDNLKNLLILADTGDREAQVSLGHMYDSDIGTERDTKVSLTWYGKAAQQGHPEGMLHLGFNQWAKGSKEIAIEWCRKAAALGFPAALFFLGTKYEAGDGVEKDAKQAVALYERAAEKGFDMAEFSLGCMFEHGNGTVKDIKSAISWYKKAAAQEYPPALFKMGMMYYAASNGIEQDLKLAVNFILKAAEKGNPDAQYNMGVMCQYGDGFTVSREIAMQWYSKAAAQGHELALKALLSGFVREGIKVENFGDLF